MLNPLMMVSIPLQQKGRIVRSEIELVRILILMLCNSLVQKEKFPNRFCAVPMKIKAKKKTSCLKAINVCIVLSDAQLESCCLSAHKGLQKKLIGYNNCSKNNNQPGLLAPVDWFVF